MRFAPLTPSDHPTWAALLATCFDRTPPDMRRLLEWLPRLYPLIAWGAWDGDALAAQYTCLLRPLRHQSQYHLVGMSLNMAVHPDYRGRGLIKHVSAPVYDQVRASGGELGLGFSNVQGVAVDRGSKGYGYRVVGQLRPTIRLVLPAIRRRRDPDFALTTEFPSLPFHPDAASTSHWSFPKSLAYLEARYALHPFRRYHYGIWREEDCLLGMVVYRPLRLFGISGVALLDIVGVDSVELLHRWLSAVRQGRAGAVFVQTLTTPGLALLPALTRAAFTIHFGRTPYFLTVKPFDNSSPSVFLESDGYEFIGGDIL